MQVKSSRLEAKPDPQDSDRGKPSDLPASRATTEDARLDELRAAVSAGTYAIPSIKVSSKLIENHIVKAKPDS